LKHPLLRLALMIAIAAQAAHVAGAQGTPIGWNDLPLVAARGHDQNGQESTYTCPPGGAPKASDWHVTGTDVYADDSPVCIAAVHAGLITYAYGGTVTVQVRRPGLNKYSGSTRNGVTSVSSDNGPYATLGAFSFVVTPRSTTATPTAGNSQQNCQMGQTFSQAEARDAYGRLTVEAAQIHVVSCSGQTFYIYQYLNRLGFRAIRPPDWANAIGGRDYATFAEALAAAAAAAGGGTSGGNRGSSGGGGGGGGTLIKWSDLPLVAARGRDQNGQRTTYTCPAGGDPGTFDSRIYGTDTYTDDSSVCVAAVHAGLISFAAGGTVSVQVQRPGLAYYTGSLRYGVTSNNWDNRPNPTLGAFTFVR
jgi:hypothetical protein